MTLHGDLLAQARRFATLDARRPKQANLRRSISAAYYALFQMLVADGTARLSRGGLNSPQYRLVVGKFEHGTMARVSREIAYSASGWVRSAGVTVTPELAEVAATFVLLQQERHRADYDTGTTFARAQALEVIEGAEAAFATWSRIKAERDSTYYLLAMLLGPPRRP